MGPAALNAWPCFFATPMRPLTQASAVRRSSAGVPSLHDLEAFERRRHVGRAVPVAAGEEDFAGRLFGPKERLWWGWWR
jgi:hypothetical protein